MTELRLNTILWIEDEEIVFECAAEGLLYNEIFEKAYGSDIAIISSDIMGQVSDDDAVSEIERLVKEAGDKPVFIGVKTAQMARTYLERYLPGAIISDSNFPLNGVEVIKWLQKHGLPDYPLLGFSAHQFEGLPKETQQFFSQTSARYICKQDDPTEIEERLATGIVFSRRYVEIAYQD